MIPLVLFQFIAIPTAEISAHPELKTQFGLVHIFVGGLPLIGVNQPTIVVNLNVAILVGSLFRLDLKVIPATFQFPYVFVNLDPRGICRCVSFPTSH